MLLQESVSQIDKSNSEHKSLTFLKIWKYQKYATHSMKILSFTIWPLVVVQDIEYGILNIFILIVCPWTMSIGHVWLLNVTMNFDGILKQTGPADILFWKECCSSILLTENAPASEFESNQPSFSKVWILHTFALPITNQIIFNWIT